MKSNQSPSEPALLTKPAPHCDYPTCPEPASLKCSRCLETHYCSAKHQKEHWPLHKKLCVAPQKKMSASVPPAPPVPLKGSVDEEDGYVDLCVICLVNVPDAQMRPCGHSMIYRYCTQEQMTRSQPCPICRKPISSFEPTSYKNLGELASGEGFNKYFQEQFNGNEEPYLRWKEVFDVLEIIGGRGSHHNVRVHLETQALSITRSEDLVKLRALSKLCSRDFFDDPSLLVVAWSRIFEVLELAMPEETKVRGKKKKQRKKKDPRKLEILNACFELGNVCAKVGDWDDARRYLNRAKEGYEEQLGRDSEKALEAKYGLIMGTAMSKNEKMEKMRDLMKRMERALGEENVITLEALSEFGGLLQRKGDYEEAEEVLERCFVGKMKVLGEDHQDTLDTLGNLGSVYDDLKNYEKALEYYERALKGFEKMLGKNHPRTLAAVMNIAIVCVREIKDYGRATEIFQKALEGSLGEITKVQKYARRI